MPNRSLEENVNSKEWQPKVESDPEGGFRLTLPGLSDFELFAETREQLEAEWRSALRSHLQAYEAAAKFVPLPRFSEPQAQTGGSEWQVVAVNDELSPI